MVIFICQNEVNVDLGAWMNNGHMGILRQIAMDCERRIKETGTILGHFAVAKRRRYEVPIEALRMVSAWNLP